MHKLIVCLDRVLVVVSVLVVVPLLLAFYLAWDYLAPQPIAEEDCYRWWP